MLRKRSGFRPSVRATVDDVSYHAYTLWLFTYNDLKTMVFPSTAFAISNALAAYRAGWAANQTGGPLILLIQLPLILSWAWINLLSFAVNNQRHLSALEEDRLNKPWRPVSRKIDRGASEKSCAGYLPSHLPRQQVVRRRKCPVCSIAALWIHLQ